MTGPVILDLQAALSEVSAVAAPLPGGAASHQPDHGPESAGFDQSNVHVYALTREASGALLMGHVSHSSHTSHSSGAGHASHSSHTSHVSGGHSSHVSGGVTGGSPTGRPDVRISAGNGLLHGDNIYNTLRHQTVAQTGGLGSTLQWHISVQNDSHAADRIRLHGAPSGVGYSVKYFAPDGTNVTHAVESGTFRTPQLAHGAAFRLTVSVRVLSQADPGLPLAGKVKAISVLTPSKTDTVEFIAERS